MFLDFCRIALYLEARGVAAKYIYRAAERFERSDSLQDYRRDILQNARAPV